MEKPKKRYMTITIIKLMDEKEVRMWRNMELERLNSYVPNSDEYWESKRVIGILNAVLGED
jgi:hypothetical protein